MRYLLTIALLLTACGGERAATIDDGGGQADAGPVWSQVEGTYQWFDDPDASFPCDGGGFARYKGEAQTPPPDHITISDGGVIRGCFWCGPDSNLAPVMSADGTIAQDPIVFGISYGAGFTGPDGQDLAHWNITAVHGTFHRGPPKSIDYLLDWSIDNGYCSGTMHVGEREVSAP